MKRINLYALALGVAITMAGCSSDNDVVADGETSSGTTTGGVGYMSINISLPTTSSSTRAVEYSDGTSDEYNVNDVTLYLFGGDNVSSATLVNTYTLNKVSLGTTTTGSDQITSKETFVIEVPSTTATNLYPVVVLNSNGNLPSLVNGSSTIAALNNTVVSASASDLTGTSQNSFFMTNAPYATAAGTSSSSASNIVICPTIDQNKFYLTEDAAKADPAATVYVERAVAKVTMSKDAGFTVTSNTDLASKVSTIEVNNWQLDNTNKYTYLMRNVACTTDWWAYASTNASSTYRFIESSSMDGDASPAVYRTHFALDPNYSGLYTSAAATDFNIISDVSEVTGGLSTTESANAQYCLENTFNVNNMTETNTTRVLVKTTLKLASGAKSDGNTTDNDIYMIDDDETTIYDKGKMVTYLTPFVLQYIADNQSSYLSDASASIASENVTVTLTGDATTGKATVSVAIGGTYTFKETSADTEAAFESAIATYINTYYPVLYYAGGVAYYRILIKHFGDTETPWEETYTGVNATTSYPGTSAEPEKNWLGRYGVLRNTWYDISVTGVKKIGSPIAPEIPDEWDDGTDEYMAFTVKMMKWAKRTQSAVLGE